MRSIVIILIAFIPQPSHSYLCQSPYSRFAFRSVGVAPLSREGVLHKNSFRTYEQHRCRMSLPESFSSKGDGEESFKIPNSRSDNVGSFLNPRQGLDSTFTDDVSWKTMPKVFVLLFNARTDNEGIYSLRVPADDLGSKKAVDVVIMFEDAEDAERYAGLLEAEGMPPATAEGIAGKEVESFVSGGGHRALFVPRGTLLIAPDVNVPEEDRSWQPGSRPKEGAGSESQGGDGVDYDEARRRLNALFRKQI